MFRVVCKIFVNCRYGYNFRANNDSSMAVPFSLVRYLSSDADKHSFTVSYLINKCGLSSKSALIVSKSIQFKTSHKPDLILSCFEKHGFSKSQISEMVKKFPRVLKCSPEKTISPRVEFFRSKGVSTPDLVKIFTVNPWILRKSLAKRLISTYSILAELFQSDDKVIGAMKRRPWGQYNQRAEFGLVPNISTLRESGVPLSNILWLFMEGCLCIGKNPIEFVKTVEEVKEMGFNPMKLQFVAAIKVLGAMTKMTRDGKVDAYKRWGWSDKDITTAFKKYPKSLSLSEDKLMAVMDFYVNILGLDSSVIANCPLVLGFSLKRKLIPRGAVIQFLCSKGLVELDSSITKVFLCTESQFLDRYVKCHKEASLLMNLYRDKLGESL